MPGGPVPVTDNPLNPFPEGGVRPLHTTIGRPMGADAVFDPVRADRAVDCIQLMKHTQGPLQGQPFLLSPEQRWLVREAFGWVKPWEADATPAPQGQRGDGWVRVVRTVYLEMGRANGKSQLGAAIAGVLLYADGESAPEIVGAAKDRKQARIILRRLAAMIRTNPDLMKRSEILRGEVRNKRNDGWYEATSADVASAWGGAPHGVIFDEIHAQPNRDLWDALVTGTGKRLQPMVWALTTAGWDRESLCWELHTYTVELSRGTMDNPSFMGVVWAADEEADWTEAETWQSANPLLALPDSRYTPSGALAAIQHEYLAAECERAEHIPAFQNTFRTMYLSQWVGQEVRFIPLESWDRCQEMPVAGKRKAFGGLDLASTTDLAAFAVAAQRGEFVDVFLRLYAPENGIVERERRDRAPYRVWARDGLLTLTPGDTIDQDYIKADVMRAAEEWELADVSYDRWNASKLVKELEAEGIVMAQMGQGFASMSAPTKELLRLVLEQKLAHGQNAALRWMVSNTAPAMDASANVKPDKKRSSGRIDGVTATIMAIDGRTRRGQEPDKRSAYENTCHKCGWRGGEHRPGCPLATPDGPPGLTLP